MMNHILKTAPEFFELAWSGQKDFEVRNNDRNFKKGDSIELLEYLGKKYHDECVDRALCNGIRSACHQERKSCTWYTEPEYSGRRIYGIVTDVFDISAVVPGFCAFKFSITEKSQRLRG